MNPPALSVITTTFNAAATIEQAILCVAKQSFRPVEHWIIDGLSTDNTVSIVKSYQEKFPHLRIISEKDRGIYDAMNRGIDLVRGNWIYFLGADDLLVHDRVFNELYSEGHFYRNDVFYGNVLVQGDTSWAKDGTLYDGRFDLHKLFRHNICHQAIFYPAGVIREAGYFNLKYHVAADWEYNIRCYARKEFVYVDKTIAVFNGGGKSSHGGTDGIGDDIPEIVMKYFYLDPTDRSLYDPSSPFYPIIKRYKKNTVFNRFVRFLDQTLLNRS